MFSPWETDALSHKQQPGKSDEANMEERLVRRSAGRSYGAPEGPHPCVFPSLKDTWSQLAVWRFTVTTKHSKRKVHVLGTTWHVINAFPPFQHVRLCPVAMATAEVTHPVLNISRRFRDVFFSILSDRNHIILHSELLSSAHLCLDL